MPDDSHADFVLESREHLQVFERSMLALERSQGAQQVVDCIDASLRAIHSLKGNAGFLGFQTVQRLAHATESVLENFRNQSLAPPISVVETILLAIDRLAALIEDLDHSQAQDITWLLKRLQGLDLNAATTGIPGDGPTIQLSLRWPDPPATILPLFESLLTLGTLSEVRLTAQDLQQSIHDWQFLKTPLVVSLQTNRSILELRERLALVGQAIPWSDLGAVELGDHGMEVFDLQRSDQQGELVYQPANLLEGVPKLPILWKTKAHAHEALPQSCSPNIQMALPGPTALPENLDPSSDDRLSGVLVESSKILAPSETIPTHGSMANLSHDVTPDRTRDEQRGLSTKPPTKVPSEFASERHSSLRIQVDLLDRLMNLVSELTLVRNQSLLAFGETDGTPQAILQRLNSVTSELQEAVLRTRMQPVGSLFGRFPRMIRDLARQLGKQVELKLVGQEVELDKSVLEQLSDPLTHLIRNSVDHGLETPDERLKQGKPVVGQVTLSATAADGQVIIEIRDDGRGIDPAAIRAKVLARGLKTEAELQKISNKELYSYILLPGFSTAKEVSDVSGRGVGMDVVKTNLERLEGSLTIDSTPGLGTTMTLQVPLTLAIIPCLIVTAGEHRFAVPQRGLEEIVCLYPGGPGSIEQAYDTELYRLRDLLLPIVRLRSVLERSVPFTSKTKSEIMAAHSPDARDPGLIEYILVLRTNGQKFGLLVDDVRGTEEIVVKPMHPSLKKIGIFSGATLMGDGRVALIANIDGIAEHARCDGVEPPKRTAGTQRDPADVHRILLFEYGPKEQFALPLVQVRRIEAIAMDQVESVGDQAFITLDGTATRIVQLDKFLNVSKCEARSTMYLLLPKFVSEPMGILVSRIVDTESLSVTLQEASIDDPGILGTAVLGGRLSLFLDTQYLRERLFGSASADPEIAVSRLKEQANVQPAAWRHSERKNARRVLLVDDTPFFREVVRRYFEREGLTVATAVDGKDGLQKLADATFDLVVSDIEMPNMDGWQFCAAARKQGYTMPFLALTSLSKLEHSTKASACGFDGFEEKLDHDRLMASVKSMLGIEHKEVVDA